MKYKGYVEYFTFRSKDGTFQIFHLVSDDFEEGEMNCLGSVPGVDEGDNIEIEGYEVVNPVYGRQIKVTSFKVLAQEDVFGMERYLASGAIKGIGAALAHRIVKKFGEDTFRIMEEEPERLAEIKGISERMAREAGVQMLEKKDLREALVFISDYGISNSMALKLYKQYGTDIYKIFRENPYRLAGEVRGIGFCKADEIAKKAGIAQNNPDRIKSGILYCLTEYAAGGNTFMPKDKLMNQAGEVLHVTGDLLEESILPLVMDGKIVVRDTNKVFLKDLYHAELGIAAKVKEIRNAFSDRPLTPAERKKLLAQVEEIKKEENLFLDDVQTEAVLDCATYGFFILTGGPGTGKTSTIRAIIRYFDSQGQNVFLCAPTGRAAKRMEEATGYEAKTIHRLLEVTGSAEDDEKAYFNRNELNPLEADVIIVDEMSMVDTVLFRSLLAAIPVGCRLILSGDANQLPSVGPGNVLKDLLKMQVFRKKTLEKIYRQSTGGDIVTNSDLIRRGMLPVTDGTGGDFFFVERSEAKVVYRDLVLLIRERIPAKFKTDPGQIQVLTPMKGGNLGVHLLNEVLQEKLNPPGDKKPELKRGDTVFRLGDKVMQIKNNYNTKWRIVGINGITGDEGEGVFNGDMGNITRVDVFDKSLTVTFEENKEVTYEKDMLEELELAYAITIHKSQGSEYPAVIIPLMEGPAPLMNRNLLYTAVSRGSRCVMILGKWSTVARMVETDGEQKRDTGLMERLREVFEDA